MNILDIKKFNKRVDIKKRKSKNESVGGNLLPKLGVIRNINFLNKIKEKQNG